MEELKTPTGQGLVQKAKSLMNDIKLVNVLEIPEFRDAVLFLKEAFSLINKDEDKRNVKSTLTENSKQHDIIAICCKICSEILETRNLDFENTEKKMESLKEMLRYFVNSSDNNSEVCTIISKELHFLRIVTRTLRDSFKKLDVNIVSLLINLLHNVAMFEGEIVRSVDSVDALRPYLDFDDNTIRLLSLATLADIVNESEAEILEYNGGVIKFLLNLLGKATGNHDRSWEGWSVSMLMWILRKVARYDKNKRAVLKHNAVPLLIKLAKKGRREEQKEAIYAIWTLSFNKKNREEMRKNTQNWNVVEVLEDMSRSEEKKLQQLSRYALWTIKEHAFPRSHEQHKASGDRNIMISYNWRQKDVAKQIYNYLHKYGIKVWMDDDDDELGFMVEDMVKAVGNVDIVLMCYSSTYKDSNYCRAEAEYAFDQKKKVIPLSIEQNSQPDGWIASIIGGKLCYEFNGNCTDERKLGNLANEIRKTLNDIDSTVKESTPVKVEEWPAEINVQKGFLDNLRDKDVAYLQQLLHESPHTFHQTIREIVKKQLTVNELQSMTDVRLAINGSVTDMPWRRSSAVLMVMTITTTLALLYWKFAR